MIQQTGRPVNTIIIIAECYQGVMTAGRFVFRHLYHENSRILLLQTFQMPSLDDQLPGSAEKSEEGIALMLKQIGERELVEFKTKLVKEFGFPADRVDTMVEEGRLSDVIRERCGELENTAVTVGSNETARQEIPCRTILLSLMETGIRPLFLVNGDIVIVGESSILIFPLRNDRLPDSYFRFFSELADTYRCSLETITRDRRFIERYLEAEMKD